MRERLATWLVLAPLVGGVALLFLTRILNDTGGIAEPYAWALGGFAALVLCGGRRHPPSIAAWMPVAPFLERVARYLAALAGLLPWLVVMGVVVASLGGGARRFLALLAVMGVAALAAVPRRDTGGPVRAGLRQLTRRMAAGFAWLSPRALRPFVRRDLLLLLRAPLGCAGLYPAIACAALGLLAVAGGGPSPRGFLCAIIASWALAACALPLLVRQQPAGWVERVSGVSPGQVWRAKVALGGLLGLLPGLLGACLWGVAAPLAAAKVLVIGAAVGAAVMEGDGRPLLNGLISLFLAVLVGALGMVFPLLLVAVPFLIRYLEGLGVPRLARHAEAAMAGT